MARNPVDPEERSSAAWSVDAEQQLEYWDAREAWQRGSDHAAARADADLTLAYLARWIELGPDTDLLDVGAGSGNFTRYLEERAPRTVGLDFSGGQLALNPARKRVRASSNELPFADRTFDVAFAAGLLHHVPDPAAALGEMARVSRRWVVAYEPNRNNPAMFAFSALHREEWAALRMHPGSLRRHAERAGLRVHACVSFGWIPSNVLPAWAVPFFRRIPPRLPFALGALLVAERAV